jgi:transposase
MDKFDRLSTAIQGEIHYDNSGKYFMLQMHRIIEKYRKVWSIQKQLRILKQL